MFFSLSCPHDVDNVHPIGEVTAQHLRLDQGYIGSCTNGRTEDIAEAAKILQGKKLPPYARLVVVPASAAVLQECMDKGYVKALMDAGATFVTPGCAACLGTHEGIVVAGRNFGCGSSREHAPIALLNMGAAAVVADSFARIFFRNGINLGLPLVVCPGAAQHVWDGQTLTLDIEAGTLTVAETGEVLPAEDLGDKAMEILAAGGIKPMMRARYGKGGE